MKKMNNKGFLLAESLIVSTFVLTVLIFLFVQFKNLMVNNKKSYTYNSVENIYDLGSLADYLKNNEDTSRPLKNQLGTNLYIEIYSGGASGTCKNLTLAGSLDLCTELGRAMELDYAIYTSSNITNIKNNMPSSLEQDMIDFIKKVDATMVENKGRIIAKFQNGNFATIAVDTDSNDSLILGTDD